MKLDGMKCPYCGKLNTHAYQVDEVCIWDDKFYECMKKEFGENRLKSGSSDNVIYRCYCNECEKYFNILDNFFPASFLFLLLISAIIKSICFFNVNLST